MGFGFFQDGKGNKSMGRLLAAPIVWTGLVLCAWGAVLLLLKPESAGVAFGAGISLVTIGFGGKTIQNFTEAKNGEIK